MILTPGDRRIRGFSLVELLVGLGVIGVLLAITLPVLFRARMTALETAIAVHQRNVGQELERYVQDRRGAFPYYGIPGNLRAPLDYPPRRLNPEGIGSLDPDGPYWGQPHFWWWLLETAGYQGALARQGPEVDPGWDLATRPTDAIALDTLTYTAFAQPRFFRNESTQPIAELLPQKWVSIATPSAKGVLFRPNRASDRRAPELAVFVYFGDGHCDLHRLSRLREGVEVRVIRESLPVLTTQDGLLGRDL